MSRLYKKVEEYMYTDLYTWYFIFGEGLVLFILYAIIINFYPYMQYDEHNNSKKATIMISLFVLASTFLIKITINNFFEEAFNMLMNIILILNTIIAFIHLKNGKYSFFWWRVGKEENKKGKVIFHYIIVIITPIIYIATRMYFNNYTPMYETVVQDVQIVTIVLGVISILDEIYTGGEKEGDDARKGYRIGVLYIVITYIFFFYIALSDTDNSVYKEKMFFCMLVFETVFVIYIFCEMVGQRTRTEELKKEYTYKIYEYKNEIKYLQELIKNQNNEKDTIRYKDIIKEENRE